MSSSRLAVGYLNTCYPCLSHTFIEREVRAVRLQGVKVETFSVRKPDERDLLSEHHRDAAASTIYLLGGLGPLIGALAWAALRRPAGLLSGLIASQRLAPPGVRSRLLHVAYLVEAARLAREMRARELRHVHVHMANNGAVVAMLACEIDPAITYSLTVHGSAEFFNVHEGRLAAKCGGATLVRCISDFCRGQVAAWAPPETLPRLRVVHCGVDVAAIPRTRKRPSRNGRPAPLKLLTIGRMEPIKGYEVLLAACRLLLASGLDFTLEMIGDGPRRPGLERAARDAGLQDRVTFAGVVGQDQIGRHFEAADVLVVSSFMEGVPVVLMEAMARGMAVVSTNVGGVAELVEDGVSGLLARPGNAESLAEALRCLAADRSLLQLMGSAGRRAVEKGFDTGSIGRQMVAFLEEAAGAAPMLAAAAGPAGADLPPYVLVTPCRDEAEYARRTLESVVGQTVPPAAWVIVDDGSTDGTLEILREYEARYPIIRVVHLADRRRRRAVGPGVVAAFEAGLATFVLDRYAYLGKVDLDLELPPRYFEILLRRMEADPRLGSCSGKPFIPRESGRLESEGCGDEMSVGPTKFYRVRCYREIGGFVPQVMWDGIDCHRSRMRGWKVRSWDDPELRFLHLRAMGSSQGGLVTGRLRHGAGQYFMGTGFTYMTASAMYRMAQRPRVVGGLAMWWGWVRSGLTGQPRYSDERFRYFLRRYQWDCLIRGKRRATQRLERRMEAAWEPRERSS